MDPVIHHKKFIELFPKKWMQASKAEQDISMHIYEYLSRKIHPDENLLASHLPYTVEQIKTILEPLEAGIYRDHGNIIGFAGLTTRPMVHALVMEGITSYAWCALDALFIPKLLGKNAQVLSSDPISNHDIRCTIGDHGTDLAPTNLVLSMIDPDAEQLEEDIVGSFCHFIHFFESETTGKQWVQEHPDTYLVSFHEALGIARLMNKTRYNQYFH